jgi:uncharacterized cupredoxin-like copper-binding protein
MTFRVATLGLFTTAVLLWPLTAEAKRPPAKTSTVRVEAGMPTEFAFAVTPKTVPRGTVSFVVVNEGMRAHDFTIAGKKTAIIAPGGSAKLTVRLTKPKGYVYFCTIAGHAVAGMKGVLKVT